MSLFPTDLPPQPYTHDLERLDDEFAWGAARCRAVAARMAVHDAAKKAAGLHLTGTEGQDDLHTKAARLEAHEANLRAYIDRRVVVSGPMGLETVAEEYGLDVVERTVLLLALIPTLGLDLYKTFGDLGSSCVSCMSADGGDAARDASGAGVTGPLREGPAVAVDPGQHV